MRVTMTAGLLGEFESPDAMHEALRALRSRGYLRLEAYSPFDTKEVDAILERKPSRLPLFILLAAIAGASGAYFLQWLTNAYLLPLRVGGRPPHYPLAYVPITFEMGVLAAAFTAFFGVLAGSRMVRLWTPQSEADGFESHTNNHFWVAVDQSDARFDAEATSAALKELGARRVSPFGAPGDKEGVA